VAERLRVLRGLYVAETAAQARQRLGGPRRATDDAFATAVARRLGELRALCDLANHLHQPQSGARSR
jgi:hypothetical protein